MNIFEGKNDFLFYGRLADTIDNLSGKSMPTHDELEFWKNKISIWKEKIHKINAEFILFIPPDKQSVYPEFVCDNISIANYRYIDSFIDNSQCDVIYPIDIFYKYKHEYELYQNADTHWNDIGAALAFNELAYKIGIKNVIDCTKETIHVGYVKGDLCVDNFSNRINKKIIFNKFNNNSTKLFDNMIYDMANIAIYENKYKDLPRALVFCDSFINTKIHIFSNFFSRLVKVSTQNLGSMYDYFISGNYDFIIYEIVERNINSLLKKPCFVPYIDHLCSLICKNTYKNSDIKSLSIQLHKKECPHTIDEIKKIESAINSYQKDFLISYIKDSNELINEKERLNFYRDVSYNKKIGAIVANCNPFHYGHRYLIEYAANKCDLLYVFVLQENTSYFNFIDRFIMVIQGCNDLKNVIPIPSGNFVISSSTFPDYFGKDKRQDVEIDASLDIEVFSNFIAPYMGITIRFVGTEPLCKITNQYNKQMSEIFKNSNIDFVEIERYKVDSTIVSATHIRRLFKDNNMVELRNFVPDTTFLYLSKYLSLSKEYSKLDISCPDQIQFYKNLYNAVRVNGDEKMMSNFFAYIQKLHPSFEIIS